MIFSKESAVQQINHLLHLYNGLSIESMHDTEIVLSGYFWVNRVARDYQLCKEYQVRIVIPLYSDELPYVIDIGNHIDESYPHRYTDGRLCLETDAAIRMHFLEGFNLEIWIRDFVEPYYFSYEYYQRYGLFPFGERAHYIEGIYQTYGEIFKEPEYEKVLLLMKFIRYGQYRGHLPCPCGSGKKLRSCHGKYVKDFFTNNSMKIIIEKDYDFIKEEFVAYDEQRRNTKASK